MTPFAVLIIVLAITIVPAIFTLREAQAGTSPTKPFRPLVPGASPTEDTVHRRKRAAKQWNERIKLVATFFNGLGIALFVAFAITIPGPIDGLTGKVVLLGLLSAGALLIVGLAVLSAWKSEE